LHKEKQEVERIACPEGCNGCSCHIAPPCAHCTEGHGTIKEEVEKPVEKFLFQVRDRVEWAGCEGEITSIENKWLLVQFGENHERFCPDGKFHYWNKEPSLKLIERPIKEVNEWWIDVENNCICSDKHRCSPMPCIRVARKVEGGKNEF
jgi:hypothetical protein